jgi:hypothetical protein
VAVTVIFTMLCVAGVAFMTHFLIALSRDGGPMSRGHVFCLTSRQQKTGDKPSRLATPEGIAFERGDVGSRPEIHGHRGERGAGLPQSWLRMGARSAVQRAYHARPMGDEARP